MPVNMRVGSGTAAAHDFSLSPQAEIPRSSFNRSHGHKTTFNAGYLIPVFVDEVLPGDTHNLSMTAFARLATPLFPIMDSLYLDSFFFFVPNRLVWEHWEEFNGQQLDPDSSTDFVMPTVTAPAVTGFTLNSLYDYFGLPTEVASFVVKNHLPLRCYNLIYNQWFRDENLIDSAVVDLDDGPDSPTDYVLRRRGKRYDYFTSCLPWPQKINDGTSVELPLGTEAPVVTDNSPVYLSAADGAQYLNRTWQANPTTNATYVSGAAVGGVQQDIHFGSTGTGLKVDLSQAVAASINQLRQAFQLQKLFERDARGGTRYTEIIRAHFGVTSPDARLQRPEYLGGSSTPINIHVVPQTSASGLTGGSTKQGSLTAFGTAAALNHGFVKSFTEHGFIIGLVSLRSDYTYQQGCERMWNRETRYDHYWPALGHIGEQQVFNKEIYADGSIDDDGTFGYQERYAEYRYKPSRISGLFRSNASGTLDAWHLAQNFADTPLLDQTFIEENPPMTRIKATNTDPDIIADIFFKQISVRPMATYAVPGLIDHF